MREYRIALAGNPNVGKSTIFNALTGLHQHTGNWPGKTVECAEGVTRRNDCLFHLIDLPGTYSLYPHSPEETAARDYLCRESPDAVLCVADATCLERSLPLVLQILEITPHAALCVNLMDEAERSGIRIDTARLSQLLGIPVLVVSAHRKKSLGNILPTLERVIRSPRAEHTPIIQYAPPIEDALFLLTPLTEAASHSRVYARYWALRLLENEDVWATEELRRLENYAETLRLARESLLRQGMGSESLTESMAETQLMLCSQWAKETTSGKNPRSIARRLRFDRALASRAVAYPFMLLLLTLVLYLTLQGANYPSQWLSRLFAAVGVRLEQLLDLLHTPPWLHAALTDGVFRILSWVVSVMLPPMAIFFPFFSLLEDVGYLPRVAFNLDHGFQRCRACGKQSLTMAMGLGCNAVGVIGCRIIDSKREQLLAILTNAFMPCNGRFPLLILLLGVVVYKPHTPWLTALLLACVILLAVLLTFAVTSLLSRTILKGQPSSFILELPPFRKPAIGQVLTRSLLDKTLSVLARAAAVAAPAGFVIWCLANLTVQGVSILSLIARSLDPIGRFLGLDGAILLAFILGFPANETVLPILLMIYTKSGSLIESAGLESVRRILLENGWEWKTAVSMLLFTLMHWPCSTTLLTIRKETKSTTYTILAAVIPTVAGVLLCAFFHFLCNLLS